jgi:hypothetical protein
MTNPKGTVFETAIVRWLQQWWPWVERRAKTGAKDRGDISGLHRVVIEAKNPKGSTFTATLSIGIAQLQAEVDNDNAVLGLLCVKRPGKTKVDEAYWLLDPRHVQRVIAAVQSAEVRAEESST